MALRPQSRFDALLDELCCDYGWCCASRKRERVRPLAGSVERLVDAILAAEGMEPDAAAGKHRNFLTGRVEEWLLRDDGPGARSGLP
jgi:hypothetical protein